MWPNDLEKHAAFKASARKHVLMMTPHGIHSWDVQPGLPDTGGQNIFVNQLSDELARRGYRITIINRGGYPHPITERRRTGIDYKDEHQRIFYIPDEYQVFLKKEAIAPRVPHMAMQLRSFMEAHELPVDLIISHYWDGAALGSWYSRMARVKVQHFWIPHSLGAVKKRNVPPEQWERLRIDERIRLERDLFRHLDAVVATSDTIRRSLREDYDYEGPVHFLPPCIDPERYRPQALPPDDEVWDFLGRRTGLPPEEVRKRQIVTEISRTDETKRKDVLIEAFAQIGDEVPNSLLVVSIEDHRKFLAGELKLLLQNKKLAKRVAVVGSVQDWLPKLYAATDVYCTPSVMEGFGMSAQEAAATGVPIVASDKVPFATEYLLGQNVEEIQINGNERVIRRGAGAIVVPANDVEGFTTALSTLLRNDELRRSMGRQAHEITVPYFTWEERVGELLEKLNLEPVDATS